MKEIKSFVNQDKDNKTENHKIKKRVKKAQLNIRLSQSEKKKLEGKAQKSGLNLSEYARVRLFGGNEKQQSPEIVSQCVILCQDILNIAEEKYRCEDNSLLEEKVEKLWKILQ